MWGGTWEVRNKADCCDRFVGLLWWRGDLSPAVVGVDRRKGNL